MQPDGQALFLLFPWRHPDRLPATQKKNKIKCIRGVLQGWGPGKWLHKPYGLTWVGAPLQRTRSSTAWHSCICWSSSIWPRSCNSKNVPFMQDTRESSALLHALLAPGCSCHVVILTLVTDHCDTDWLFFLCGYIWLLLLLCIVLCWLQYCHCDQVFRFTAE